MSSEEECLEYLGKKYKSFICSSLDDLFQKKHFIKLSDCIVPSPRSGDISSAVSKLQTFVGGEKKLLDKNQYEKKDRKALLESVSFIISKLKKPSRPKKGPRKRIKTPKKPSESPKKEETEKKNPEKKKDSLRKKEAPKIPNKKKRVPRTLPKKIDRNIFITRTGIGQKKFARPKPPSRKNRKKKALLVKNAFESLFLTKDEAKEMKEKARSGKKKSKKVDEKDNEKVIDDSEKDNEDEKDDEKDNEDQIVKEDEVAKEIEVTKEELDAEKKRLEEERKKFEEERQRLEDERKKLREKQRKELEEERKRFLEEKRKYEEQKRKLEEDRRRIREEEEERERKEAEELKMKKEEEERKKKEELERIEREKEEKRKIEEEKRRIAKEKEEEQKRIAREKEEEEKRIAKEKEEEEKRKEEERKGKEKEELEKKIQQEREEEEKKKQAERAKFIEEKRKYEESLREFEKQKRLVEEEALKLQEMEENQRYQEELDNVNEEEEEEGEGEGDGDGEGDGEDELSDVSEGEDEGEVEGDGERDVSTPSDSTPMSVVHEGGGGEKSVPPEKKESTTTITTTIKVSTTQNVSMGKSSGSGNRKKAYKGGSQTVDFSKNPKLFKKFKAEMEKKDSKKKAMEQKKAQKLKSFLNKLPPTQRKEYSALIQKSSSSKTISGGSVVLPMKQTSFFNSELGISNSQKVNIKTYIRKIISFFSEYEIYKDVITNKTLLSLYPAYLINTILEISRMLKNKKVDNSIFLKSIIMLFIEKQVAKKIITQIQSSKSKKQVDMDLKCLLELLILPISYDYYAIKKVKKKRKYKFIAMKEKVVKKFISKYVSSLILEPSLFVKVISFVSYKIVKKIITDESFKISLSFADTLFILRRFEEQSLRTVAIKCLDKYPSEQMLVLVKPLVQLLKIEQKISQDLIGNFLLKLSQKSLKLWCTINWELIVENELFDFQFYMTGILSHNKKMEFSTMLQKQYKLKNLVMEMSKKLSSSRLVRQKKIVLMRKFLNEEKGWNEIISKSNDNPFYLPFTDAMDLSKNVIGLDNESCTIFKSNKQPLKIVFNTPESNKQISVLFKKGDDLRQDQIIINMIAFMDSLLKMHKLDLKIVTYSIMGTNLKAGFIELVPHSFNLTEILGGFDSIVEFLQFFNPDKERYDVAVDNFTKSLAGYSVMTYLLGVGDRHFENLMLTINGNFFHVDFSFIFGKDPKPGMSAKMRITEEMIQVLGGLGGKKFYEFSILLCKTYNQLRYHSNVILTLLYCLIGSKITHVTSDNIQKVVKKFRLDLNDKQADVHILTVLFKDLTAIMPKIGEQIHKIAQSLRN